MALHFIHTRGLGSAIEWGGTRSRSQPLGALGVGPNISLPSFSKGAITAGSEWAPFKGDHDNWRNQTEELLARVDGVELDAPLANELVTLKNELNNRVGAAVAQIESNWEWGCSFCTNRVASRDRLLKDGMWNLVAAYRDFVNSTNDVFARQEIAINARDTANQNAQALASQQNEIRGYADSLRKAAETARGALRPYETAFSEADAAFQGAAQYADSPSREVKNLYIATKTARDRFNTLMVDLRNDVSDLENAVSEAISAIDMPLGTGLTRAKAVVSEHAGDLSSIRSAASTIASSRDSVVTAALATQSRGEEVASAADAAREAAEKDAAAKAEAEAAAKASTRAERAQRQADAAQGSPEWKRLQDMADALAETAAGLGVRVTTSSELADAANQQLVNTLAAAGLSLEDLKKPSMLPWIVGGGIGVVALILALRR